MVSDRIETLITHFCKGNKSLFAKQIGVTPSVIGNITGERRGNPSFEVAQKILDAFVTISPDWLMLGRGSMLREDDVQQLIQPTSATSDAVSLRLMDRLEEKDVKIDHLQSELRTMEKELVALKTIHSQFQDKESGHQSRISEAMEAFTLESSGGSGEDFLPTKPPTTSKRSSAGKM